MERSKLTASSSSNLKVGFAGQFFVAISEALSLSPDAPHQHNTTLHGSKTTCLPKGLHLAGQAQQPSKRSLKPKRRRKTKDKPLLEPKQPFPSNLHHKELQLERLQEHPHLPTQQYSVPVLRPDARAVARLQDEEGLLSQSQNSLVDARKNLARSLRRRRQIGERRRTKRRQRKMRGTDGEMQRVGGVRSEEGSVVATWVRVNARLRMRQ